MVHKVVSLALDLERGVDGLVVTAVFHTIQLYQHFGNVGPRKHRRAAIAPFPEPVYVPELLCSRLCHL
ncbi:hypothetical protein H4R18_005686 [Coemansia javaensis]|uniref:Uncharacterized protein n=1 Tax=Coemansia javaensis TaxID=2761396 RepID=A0A9W8H4E1_9FUNG|nr:hypothetical protein H4R18_005686 [Coemansia javaensis]